MRAKNRLKWVVLVVGLPNVVALSCSGTARNFGDPSGESGAGGSASDAAGGRGGVGGSSAVGNGSSAGAISSAGSDGSDAAGSAGSDGADAAGSAGSDGAGASSGAGSGGVASGAGSGGVVSSAGSGGAACQPETDPAFCQRLAKTCGSVVARDNCGNQRTASCGSCAALSLCGADNTCMPCLQESNAAFCARLGKTCGSVTATDNCEAQRTSTCGLCSGVQVCGDKNSCIVPLTCTGTAASGPFSIFNLTGSVVPTPAGGVLVDGFYLATAVNYYGARDSVEGGAIEVKSGTVRKIRTVYSTASSSALTGYTFAGSYTLSNKNIVITADNCTYGGTLMTMYGYSSNASLIKLFDTVSGAVAVVTYQLQP